MSSNPGTVLNAIEQQAVCYRTLATLADEQHRHVRNPGAAGERALLDVLRRRQEVMTQVASLEPILSGIRQDWPTFAATLAATDRERAEQFLAEIRELLTRITDGDRDDTLVLQQRKINAGKALGETRAKSSAGRRYAGNAYAKQKSVDLSS